MLASQVGKNQRIEPATRVRIPAGAFSVFTDVNVYRRFVAPLLLCDLGIVRENGWFTVIGLWAMKVWMAAPLQTSCDAY
jgi:hypothetical protein